MRVVAVVPWRPSPGREPLMEAVRTRLDQSLPQALRILYDSDDRPFNRAASRNGGVQRAQENGADVVVVCDADTVPEVGPLQEAVARAGDGRLHLPYTWFRMLSPAGTTGWLSGRRADECAVEEEHGHAVGGVLVCTPSTWWACGGQDEGFVGWGMEDTAFWAVADTLAGLIRHPGTITHLTHATAHSERGIGSPDYRRNAKRCKLYTDARGNPERMRALLEEQHAAAGV